MKSLQILLSLMMVVLLISCASGISKKGKGILQNNASTVLTDAFSNEEYFVLNDAVEAMGNSEDVSFVPLLTDALHDPDYIVRMQAARSLGNLGLRDTTAIISLKLVLNFDSEFAARKAAAVALYRLGEKELAMKFIKEALNDESGMIRSSMITETTFAKSDEFIPLYIERLKDEVGLVRDDAISALSFLDARSAVPQIMETIQDSFLLIRINAIATISDLGDSTQIREAMNITKAEIDKIEAGEMDNIFSFDENQFMAYKILYEGTLLLELDDATSTDYLWDITINPNTNLSALSTIILAQWGEEYAIELIEDFITHEDVNFRVNAVSILGRIDKEWVWRYLLMDRQDKDVEVRKVVAYALRFYNEKEVKEALVTMLEDPDPYVQIEASLSLNELGCKDGYHVLQAIMNNNEDWYIKVKAAEALYSIINS